MTSLVVRRGKVDAFVVHTKAGSLDNQVTVHDRPIVHVELHGELVCAARKEGFNEVVDDFFKVALVDVAVVVVAGMSVRELDAVDFLAEAEGGIGKLENGSLGVERGLRVVLHRTGAAKGVSFRPRSGELCQTVT